MMIKSQMILSPTITSFPSAPKRSKNQKSGRRKLAIFVLMVLIFIGLFFLY